MRDNSDKRKKRTAPLLCAALAVACSGAFLAVIVYCLLGVGSEIGAVRVLLALYALAVLAVIAGVLIALRQRLREIEGGEEDDAAQY